jgi:hypothetical protein
MFINVYHLLIEICTKIFNYLFLYNAIMQKNKTITTMALASIGLLSAADKVKLRAKLQTQVAGLEFGITSATIRKEKALATATNIDTGITTQQALYDSYTTVEASQTPGSALQLEFAEKKTIASENLAKLTRQKAKFGVGAVVESESTIEVLQARIDVLNGHIAELA